MVSCALVLLAARSARADEPRPRDAPTPDLPDLPALPAQPDVPTRPDMPAQPDTPVKPDQPMVPATPALPLLPSSDSHDDSMVDVEGENDDSDGDDEMDGPPAFVDAADYDALDDDRVFVPVQDRKGPPPPPLPPGDAKPGKHEKKRHPPHAKGPKRGHPPMARVPHGKPPHKRRPPTARIPRVKPPHPPHRPHPHARRGPPPQAFGKMRMFLYKDQNVTRAGVHFERDARPHDARPHDDGRAHSGAALSASGTRVFGMDPIGDVLIGARVHLAAALPTIHQGSRWLSTGTIGLKGGIDLQTASAATAQLWHVGVAFGMGAPWSRDVVGVGIEGGILGGRYHDSRPEALVMSQNRTVAGPYAENIGPNAYGAASLTLQLPLRGNVRPFMSGDFGVTSRDDDKVATLAGLRGGLVWTAW